MMALRTVGKLVSIPPAQRSVTDGIPTAVAFSETISLACFLVATKRILRPLLARAFISSAASSTLTTVLCRSMMWMPFFWSKIYGAILGFHLRARCPKCAPASSNSWKFVLDIIVCFLFCFFSFHQSHGSGPGPVREIFRSVAAVQKGWFRNHNCAIKQVDN